jgi:2-keto-myo-inositol isomerase
MKFGSRCGRRGVPRGETDGRKTQRKDRRTVTDLSFALNHMAAPKLPLGAFLDLAREMGVEGVEIRNDLDGNAILDGTSAETVRREAEARGLTILSINALQRFNMWSEARAREAQQLAAYARDCGAKALVLVPVNDTAYRPAEAERLAGLRQALSALDRILGAAGLIGFVEPLGFEECSLRLKREAVDAIDELGLGARFRLVHDTFHHHLSGETETFPTRTGLVHISGVEDTQTPLNQIRDRHRVLVGPVDILGNATQIEGLLGSGYSGPLSFEPFAATVHDLPDIKGALKGSMAFLEASLG